MTHVASEATRGESLWGNYSTVICVPATSMRPRNRAKPGQTSPPLDGGARVSPS
jgi:hypothetical protein